LVSSLWVTYPAGMVFDFILIVLLTSYCCYSSVHGIFQANIYGRGKFPSPGDLPNLEIEPASPASTAIQVDSL